MFDIEMVKNEILQMQPEQMLKVKQEIDKIVEKTLLKRVERAEGFKDWAIYGGWIKD